MRARALGLWLWLGALAGLCLSAEPPRTLLVQVQDVPAALQLGQGRFAYNDYHRETVISLVRNTAMVLATPAELAAL